MSKEEQLNRRWQKLCADIAILARERGAQEPFIYACESGLCVTDGPPNGAASVLFMLSKPPSSVVTFDAGGW
jgi:hypothetical protein